MLGKYKRLITSVTQTQVVPITTEGLYTQFWWENKSCVNHTILVQDTVMYWTTYLNPYLHCALDLFQTWKKSQRSHQVVFGCNSEWSCLNDTHSLGSPDSPDNLTWEIQISLSQEQVKSLPFNLTDFMQTHSPTHFFPGHVMLDNCMHIFRLMLEKRSWAQSSAVMESSI